MCLTLDHNCTPWREHSGFHYHCHHHPHHRSTLPPSLGNASLHSPHYRWRPTPTAEHRMHSLISTDTHYHTLAINNVLPHLWVAFAAFQIFSLISILIPASTSIVVVAWPLLEPLAHEDCVVDRSLICGHNVLSNIVILCGLVMAILIVLILAVVSPELCTVCQILVPSLQTKHFTCTAIQCHSRKKLVLHAE